MTPSEALDLIDRAEHAESDRRLRQVLEWIGYRVPKFRASLHDRLELIIMATTLASEPSEVLLAMGEAFFENGMMPDAIDYVHDAWENCAVTQSLHEMIMECWNDQKRGRFPRLCEGFKKPPLHGQPVPLWQRPESDIALIFGTWQSGADGAAAWGRESWNGYKGNKDGRRPWGRDSAKLSGEVLEVCKACHRFTRDCKLIFPLGHDLGLDNALSPLSVTVVRPRTPAPALAAIGKPAWYPTHVKATQSRVDFFRAQKSNSLATSIETPEGETA